MLATGLLTVAARSQAAATGALSGTVSDTTGAHIAGASVHIEGLRTVDLRADAVGHFAVDLAAGSYTVRVVAPGFAVYENAVELSAVGARLAITLPVATREEQLTVPADGEASASSSDNASAVVFKGDDLKVFSNDDATFQKEVLALAGGAGGRPPQVLIDGFLGGKFPPKSSIREIRINKNPYSAEYQDLGYGRFEVFTKPGKDKLHGGLNVNATDSPFNARNPFLQTAELPYYQLNLDGNLTGPIDKKTSFYLAGLVNDQQNNAALNAVTDGQHTPYTAAVRDPQLTNTYSLRVDRQVTPNNTLTARYEFSQVTQTNGGLTAPLTLATQAFNSGTTQQTLQLSDTQVIGQHTIAETRFQYVRTRLQQGALSATPTLLVEGAFNGGGNPLQSLHDNQDRYELQEYVSHQAGKQFFRIGGMYRLQREANLSTANYNGQYVFPTLAAYQAGTPSQYSVTTGLASASILTGALSMYIDDEWKVRKNVTIDLGFRLETQSAIPDHFDPAPRIGANWAFTRKGKTKPFVILRGGGGLFYDRFSAANLLTAVRQNGVSQQSFFVANPTYNPNGAPAGALGTVPPTVYRVSPNLRSEYGIAAGATLEKIIGKLGSVSVNYIFVRGDHQFVSRNVNAPLPGTYDPTVPGSGVRPMGGAQNVYEFDSNGTQKTQDLYFNTRLNLSKRVTVFALYTINYTHQNTQGPASFASNSYNLAQDFGRAAQTTNGLFTGGTLQAPFGISVNAFASTQGGTPFNITTGTDLNGDTIYNDRPAFATAPTAASMIYKTRVGTFDANPQPGEQIVPINYGNSPNFAFLDLSMSRSFAVGPRPAATPVAAGAKPAPKPDRPWSLSFSVDAGNVLNTRNAATPVGVLSSPYFGQSLTENTLFSANTAANRVVFLQTSFSF